VSFIHHRRTGLWTGVIVAALFLLDLPVSGEVRYTIERLDAGFPGATSSRASGINNQGQVVGSVQWGSPPWPTVNQLPFIYSAGTMTTLQTPEHNRGAATAINDSGTVLGSWAWTISPPNTAFIYENGTFQDLNFECGNPADINNRGQAILQEWGTFRGFLYDGSSMRELPKPPPEYGGDDGETTPWAINNHGQVVGAWGQAMVDQGPGPMTAFLYDSDSDTAQNLPYPPPGPGGGPGAFGINDLGQIVGSGAALGHAVLWTDGQVYDLGKPADTYEASADAINNHGQIVGMAYASGGPGYRALLWDEDRVLWNLNDLIPPDSGWNLMFAEDINDAGQIVGFGKWNGDYHAFLLNPVGVPEPHAMALVLFAAAALVRRRR